MNKRIDGITSELSFEEHIWVSYTTGDGEGGREHGREGGTSRRNARGKKMREARGKLDIQAEAMKSTAYYSKTYRFYPEDSCKL